eukprot:scaffold14471_cov113-Isochrysis_galbana.AAC.10
MASRRLKSARFSSASRSRHLIRLCDIGVPGVIGHRALEPLERPVESLLLHDHLRREHLALCLAHGLRVVDPQCDPPRPRQCPPIGGMLSIGQVGPKLVEGGMLARHRAERLLQRSATASISGSWRRSEFSMATKEAVTSAPASDTRALMTRSSWRATSLWRCARKSRAAAALTEKRPRCTRGGSSASTAAAHRSCSRMSAATSLTDRVAAPSLARWLGTSSCAIGTYGASRAK